MDGTFVATLSSAGQAVEDAVKVVQAAGENPTEIVNGLLKHRWVFRGTKAQMVSVANTLKTKLAEGLTPKFAALLDQPVAGGGTVFEGMVMYLNRGFPF